MSLNINQVTIVGRITRNPELKTLPNGTMVTSFSLATNRVYTHNGQKQEETEFHNITVFGKVAENCAQWLAQGQEVGVIGRLRTRSWENGDVRHYRTEILAETVQFGSKPGGHENKQQRQSRPPKTGGIESLGVDENGDSYIDYSVGEANPDDIPF